MSDEPFFAVVNTAAGGGRCRARFDGAYRRLTEGGLVVEPHFTDGPGHAIELIHEAYVAGRRRFLAVGGDGTGYEAVNGLFADDRAPEGAVLGILPLGTGNSFLRDFGVLSEEAAIAAILRGKTREVDVVRCEHGAGVLHYMNLLSIGFTARVGALTNERFKGLGSAGYVAAVLASLARLEHPVDPVALDSGPRDARPAVFLTFSNSQYTGGAMHMAPHASTSDGKLDVIRAGELGRLAIATTLPKIFTGKHVHKAGVEESQVARVDFLEPREQDVMIDGEVLRLTLHNLEVRRAALTLLV